MEAAIFYMHICKRSDLTLCIHREAFFMFGSDVSFLFSAETKKPLDAETPLLSDARYGHICVACNYC